MPEVVDGELGLPARADPCQRVCHDASAVDDEVDRQVTSHDRSGERAHAVEISEVESRDFGSGHGSEVGAGQVRASRGHDDARAGRRQGHGRRPAESRVAPGDDRCRAGQVDSVSTSLVVLDGPRPEPRGCCLSEQALTPPGVDCLSDELTIGDVSVAIGLSVHAIRYFEREGVFLREIPRTAGRHRVFTQADVTWLTLVNRLRASGMPLAKIKVFATLVRAGPGNEHDRLDLLETHERTVHARIEELQDCLDVIHSKVTTYHQHLVEGIAAGVWAPRT